MPAVRLSETSPCAGTGCTSHHQDRGDRVGRVQITKHSVLWAGLLAVKQQGATQDQPSTAGHEPLLHRARHQPGRTRYCPAPRDLHPGLEGLSAVPRHCMSAATGPVWLLGMGGTLRMRMRMTLASPAPVASLTLLIGLTRCCPVAVQAAHTSGWWLPGAAAYRMLQIAYLEGGKGVIRLPHCASYPGKLRRWLPKLCICLVVTLPYCLLALHVFNSQLQCGL